jgi:hypothetical protein
VDQLSDPDFISGTHEREDKKYIQYPHSQGYLCLREIKITFYQDFPHLMSANY